MSGRKDVLEKFIKHNSYMQDRIESGIEENRKGYAEITVVDKDGKVVEGAKITATQKNHEFRYGANIFMLDEFESEEKNALYKEYFKGFNIATLPFYWADLEPTEGKPRYAVDSERVYRRPPIDLCINYCRENGIEPREHCLNYDPFTPEWVKGLSAPEIKKKLEIRFKDLAEHYKDIIPCWEVTNETLYLNNGEKNAFYDEPDFVEWSFKTAEKYLSGNKLAINEAHCNAWDDAFNETRSPYYMQIERAMAKGARIDCIGLQFHMFYTKEEEFEKTRKFYDPKHLYAVMDRYSDFNRPLQITEVTIPCYSDSAEDEQIQAELIEYLYSIWFSHKNVEQIIYWNLVDGYAAFAPQGDMTAGENYYYGGLIGFDLKPKPAYYKIKELFEKRWHTEAEVVSDREGYAAFKGFYGEYDITVENGGEITHHTINLSKSNKGCFTINL